MTTDREPSCEGATAHDEQIKAQIDALDLRMERIEGSISGLVDAWNAAGTLLTFVKFAASIVAAAGVLWAAIRVGWKHP